VQASGMCVWGDLELVPGGHSPTRSPWRAGRGHVVGGKCEYSWYGLFCAGRLRWCKCERACCGSWFRLWECRYGRQ
jgi:hypothetical protein